MPSPNSPNIPLSLSLFFKRKFIFALVFTDILLLCIYFANKNVACTSNLHQGLQDVSQSHVERLLEGESGANLERGPIGGICGPTPVAHVLVLVEWSARRNVFLKLVLYFWKFCHTTKRSRFQCNAQR